MKFQDIKVGQCFRRTSDAIFIYHKRNDYCKIIGRLDGAVCYTYTTLHDSEFNIDRSYTIVEFKTSYHDLPDVVKFKDIKPGNEFIWRGDRFQKIPDTKMFNTVSNAIMYVEFKPYNFKDEEEVTVL